MNRLSHKLHNLSQRRQRVRSKINGSIERPRLSTHISNKHITAQLIDDQNNKTLIYVSTIGNKKTINGTMTDKASIIGQEIAKQALAKKYRQVVFDKGGKIYHGRVAALADAARKEGLEF